MVGFQTNSPKKELQGPLFGRFSLVYLFLTCFCETEIYFSAKIWLEEIYVTPLI